MLCTITLSFWTANYIFLHYRPRIEPIVVAKVFFQMPNLPNDLHGIRNYVKSRVDLSFRLFGYQQISFCLPLLCLPIPLCQRWPWRHMPSSPSCWTCWPIGHVSTPGTDTDRDIRSARRPLHRRWTDSSRGRSCRWRRTRGRESPARNTSCRRPVKIWKNYF